MPSNYEKKALKTLIEANHSPIHNTGEKAGLYFPPNYIFLPKWLESYPLSLRWYLLWHELRHMEDEKMASRFSFATFPYNDLVQYLIFHFFKTIKEKNLSESVISLKYILDIEMKLALIYGHANFVREAVPTYLQCINYDAIFEWISNKGIEKSGSLEMKRLGETINSLLNEGKGSKTHVEGFNLAKEYYTQCSKIGDFLVGMNVALQIEPIDLLNLEFEEVKSLIQENPLKYDANYRCKKLIENPSEFKPLAIEVLESPEAVENPFDMYKTRTAEVMLNPKLPEGFRKLHKTILGKLKPQSKKGEDLIETIRLKGYNTPYGTIYFHTVAMNDSRAKKTFLDTLSLDYVKEQILRYHGFSRFGDDFLKSMEFLLRELPGGDSERFYEEIEKIIDSTWA